MITVTSIKELIQRITGKKSEHRKMTGQEKWLLFLLAGLLFAVIIFPSKGTDGKAGGGLFSEKAAGSGNNMGVGGTNTGAYAADGESLDESMERASSYSDYLSRQLEAVLSQIEGVGEVTAWVQVSDSGEKVLYETESGKSTSLSEADSAGGTRTEQTSDKEVSVLTDKEGNPYVVRVEDPEVIGVLVVAEGADDSTVKKNITEAVEVLFDLAPHRIKVAKKTSKGQ